MTEFGPSPRSVGVSPPPDNATAQLSDLPICFRCRAELLRRYGGEDRVARIWEEAAADVELALLGHADERLTLQEAAGESGYTLKHFRRLIDQGKIPREPDGTIKRRNVPIKPGSGIASRTTPPPSSRSQLARAVAGGK